MNAAILCAKAAAVPSLREETLPLSDFVWMMPADKAHIYTQCAPRHAHAPAQATLASVFAGSTRQCA